ncbi:PfkB family carbohydrate kinase [Streptomyces sp. NPDC048387]|uniref:PfkB family carbohydrate kinase n=1 Tax=Streptomyces sp. NPDC048387 TaxID=3365542 RepID=UPI0037244BDD
MSVDPYEVIAAQRLLPVLRSGDAEEAVRLTVTLLAAGCRAVELTTSTPGWAGAVARTARLSDVRGRPAVIGVGTVTTAADAEAALDAGAAFLVSPYPAPEVREVAVRRGAAFLEGGCTPGEIAAAVRSSGAAKVFPAHVGGPAFIRSLRAVLPAALLVPTGGITPDDVPAWLAAGATAVGIGSGLPTDPAALAALFTKLAAPDPAGGPLPGAEPARRAGGVPDADVSVPRGGRPGRPPGGVRSSRGYDVLVLGEVLLEIHADAPLRAAVDGTAARISYSGDALNAAAAAAAAGARTALLAVVGEDELSAPLLRRAAELGVDVSHVRRAPYPNGAYLLCADPDGGREFVYWRTRSAGSTLSAAHVASWRDLLTGARALITSGIAGALSTTSREAVLAAARTVHGAGGHVTYDPNFRPRLTGRDEARSLLAALAPLTGLLKTSCPADALALVGTDDPRTAAARYRALGARAVAVTAGADRLLLDEGVRAAHHPVPVDPDPVDATGAGDCFTGTATARLALGDPLPRAVALGVAAASLSVSGRGGTGRVPAFAQTAALAATLPPPTPVPPTPRRPPLPPASSPPPSSPPAPRTGAAP